MKVSNVFQEQRDLTLEWEHEISPKREISPHNDEGHDADDAQQQQHCNVEIADPGRNDVNTIVVFFETMRRNGQEDNEEDESRSDMNLSSFVLICLSVVTETKMEFISRCSRIDK